MTQERFINILDNQDLLSTITYEELKTIVLAYPYAHNLRVLLAIKSKQEQHPDLQRNMGLAATYSLDRRRLFQVMAPKVLAPQVAAPIEIPQEELLQLKPVQVVAQELKQKLELPIEEPATIKKSVAMEPLREVQHVAPNTSIEKSEHRQEEVIHDFSSLLRQKSQVVDPTIEPPIPIATPNLLTPQETTIAPRNIHGWLQQINLPPLQGASKVAASLQDKTTFSKAMESTKAPKEKKTESSSDLHSKSLAERSVSENTGIVSETLAKLYVNQGYIDKAILMYQRLSLAFPEKSLYFAAAIEKLKLKN